MKKFRVLFADPTGVRDAQELEIIATSFPDAYVKSRAYQECFYGLVIKSIERLDFVDD